MIRLGRSQLFIGVHPLIANFSSSGGGGGDRPDSHYQVAEPTFSWPLLPLMLSNGFWPATLVSNR